ncbi:MULTISPECIES: helix-turn-helix domain-containing protein [Flammeovirga]|uniref:Transcriptional regulator n=1 Tax=Flammeovirga agarivorans TaxID=2726742 RepID=A0A7X8SGZ1_9BACT|nr:MULTISPECIES: hypothetical protein [Flammeovirga]NLR90071.1 hypothetical protein [Flammeovirga agarivorans]
MSREIKFSKFLMGLCLNTGSTFQDVAKKLGICATSDEINVLAEQMKHQGLIGDVENHGYVTKADLTAKGIQQAQHMMEWAN